MHDGRRETVEEGHALADLQRKLGLLSQEQGLAGLVEQVVQRAPRHELGDDAQVGRLQTCAHEAHQPRVVQVPEGGDLLLQLLELQGRDAVAVLAEELLDGHLRALEAAAVHRAEAARAQALVLRQRAELNLLVPVEPQLVLAARRRPPASAALRGRLRVRRRQRRRGSRPLPPLRSRRRFRGSRCRRRRQRGCRIRRHRLRRPATPRRLRRRGPCGLCGPSLTLR
mmetsp:Transcript_20002/g.63416  ORF Transcript_20002/g.63416 Transcript_20002/m.63416 type:complete len:226 (-) Transcript_20002:1573-2250(-)